MAALPKESSIHDYIRVVKCVWGRLGSGYSLEHTFLCSCRKSDTRSSRRVAYPTVHAVVVGDTSSDRVRTLLIRRVQLTFVQSGLSAHLVCDANGVPAFDDSGMRAVAAP